MTWMSKITPFRSFLIFGALSFLVGCASEASVQGMTVSALESPTFVVPKDLERGISIRSVTGGEETNPMWTSEVGNEAFRDALAFSLRNNSLLATESAGRFVLDANLIDVEQPLIGFDTKVTSTVQYRLEHVDKVDEPYEDLVVESYTAKMSESWYGVERLRLANEGSIRNNINTFIRRVVEHYDQ